MKQNIIRKDKKVVRHFLKTFERNDTARREDIKSINVNFFVFHCVITFEGASPLPGLVGNY